MHKNPQNLPSKFSKLATTHFKIKNELDDQIFQIPRQISTTNKPYVSYEVNPFVSDL